MLHPAVEVRRSLPVPFAFDRAKVPPRLARARRAEIQYASQLRKLARFIGDIITGLWDPDHPETVTRIDNFLRRYAKTIEPWAEAVARRMVEEVAVRDRQMWKEIGDQMGRALRREIDTAPTGAVMQQRLADQVRLITSLPTEAAERVHRLTQESLVTSERASEIAKEIMRTSDVTESRAKLIARTEVSRTATELTKARAEHVGSVQFQWVTVGDSDVRPSHRKLNGKVFRWDDPPICDPPSHRALPGCIWNCRCVPRPIIPD